MLSVYWSLLCVNNKRVSFGLGKAHRAIGNSTITIFDGKILIVANFKRFPLSSYSILKISIKMMNVMKNNKTAAINVILSI